MKVLLVRKREQGWRSDESARLPPMWLAFDSGPVPYSCFEKGCPTKPYATIPKGVMGNGGSWSLMEALGISTTWRETVQTREFMPYLFLLVNTMILNSQRQTLSTQNTNRHCRVRFNTFVRQPLSKQPYMGSVCCWFSTCSEGFYRVLRFPSSTKTYTVSSN